MLCSRIRQSSRGAAAPRAVRARQSLRARVVLRARSSSGRWVASARLAAAAANTATASAGALRSAMRLQLFVALILLFGVTFFVHHSLLATHEERQATSPRGLCLAPSHADANLMVATPLLLEADDPSGAVTALEARLALLFQREAPCHAQPPVAHRPLSLIHI